MIRTFMTLAVAAAAIAGAARDAQAQAVDIRATAPPPPAVTVQAAAPAPAVVSETGTAVRTGASVAGLLGFNYGGGTAFFGFGARGGYTLPMHLYVGGELGYSVGSVGLFHIQAEVGYDIGLAAVPALLIRPYAGLGFADFFASACVTIGTISDCASGSSGGDFLLSPGVEGLYHILPNVFVGGDLRVPIYLGSYTTAGFALFATGGYRF
jgi:hypothetical protein